MEERIKNWTNGRRKDTRNGSETDGFRRTWKWRTAGPKFEPTKHAGVHCTRPNPSVGRSALPMRRIFESNEALTHR